MKEEMYQLALFPFVGSQDSVDMFKVTMDLRIFIREFGHFIDLFK